MMVFKPGQIKPGQIKPGQIKRGNSIEREIQDGRF
jgi:hypothetical protein